MKKETTYRQCLPAMVFQSENIGFTRLWSRDIVDGFECSDNGSVVNKFEMWVVKFALFCSQSFAPFFNYPGVQCFHFCNNSWYNDVRNGFKNPVADSISWNKFDSNVFSCVESVGQFTDQLTGINNTWGKPVGERENILNNDNSPVSSTDAHNSLVNRIRFTLKHVAYTS